MTTFAVNFTVPDAMVTPVLTAWQVLYPKLSGESNLNYVKRLFIIWGTNAYNNGQDQINSQNSSVPDAGITTS